MSVFTYPWNVLLEMSQDVRREAQKCIEAWLPAIARQEAHKQALLVCLRQSTSLGKCLHLVLELEWKRLLDGAGVTSS